MNDNLTVIAQSDTRKSLSDNEKRVPNKWLSQKEIGELVKEVRQMLGGISQKELARRVGRPGSQSVISEIETEGREPDPGILLDIAALIGEGVDYFQAASDESERERREKLIAARWMERIATQLRAEAAMDPSRSGGSQAKLLEQRAPAQDPGAKEPMSREGKDADVA